MDRAYSKRELDMRFNSIVEKNDAWNATILEKLDDLDKFRLTPTLEQAKKTNGRVDRLEKWRVWLTGCSFVFIPAFTAVAGWFIYTQLTLEAAIRSAVNERLNEYEIIVNDE